MNIQEITRYKFQGKEFDSLDKVKTEIENRIGSIIENADVTLNPKQKLNLLKAIIDNKKDLANLLTVTYDVHSSLTGYQEKNILDF